MELPSSSLWAAFEAGHRFKTGAGVVSMECREAGALVLPTGRVVACDPQVDLTAIPLETRVDPGEYPAFLALAQSDVALVMIQFNEGRPDRWVASSERCGVDSATACLMDAKLCRMLLRQAEAGKWERSWKRIEDSMAENNGSWANICLHQASGANMLVFRTYGGDGRFATYWGYSAKGKLICSITDMFLENGVEEI